MTYTYALLPVSAPTYREVYEALERAGYSDQFHPSEGGAVAIDMHGIALVPNPVHNELELDELRRAVEHVTEERDDARAQFFAALDLIAPAHERGIGGLDFVAHFVGRWAESVDPLKRENRHLMTRVAELEAERDQAAPLLTAADAYFNATPVDREPLQALCLRAAEYGGRRKGGT